MGNGRKSKIGSVVRRAAKRGRQLLSEAKTKTASAPSQGQAIVAFMNPDGETIQEAEIPSGVSILALAQELGIDIDHFCGGQCSCGTCRIKVLNGAHNLSAQSSAEVLVLGKASVAKGDRLACQTKVEGPVQIEIPRWF